MYGCTDVPQCEVTPWHSTYIRCYSMPYAIWLMASALLSVIDSTSRTYSGGSMPAHLPSTVIASLVKRTSRFLDE
ncbi:unnamed protein product [Lasius platythorax]|uniref:Uncharacterized protein n=1 Tax=Lasius platythorax TaxID=488582 RepID=A0AAV2PD20_9HYME